MSQKGQLWCLSWWFYFLSWDNSDVFPGGFAFCLGITLIDAIYFGWVGWWISGNMRELRHLCGHLLPDFGEWMGFMPSISLKITYFLQFSTLWQFATLLGPGKRTPPNLPKKNFFLNLSKEIWHLVGSIFRDESKWKIDCNLSIPSK